MFFISKEAQQINGEIRDKELRVVSADGEQLGIMSAKAALKLAEDSDLDLVKIAPQAKPPVCKIMIIQSSAMSRLKGKRKTVKTRNRLKRRKSAFQLQ